MNNRRDNDLNFDFKIFDSPIDFRNSLREINKINNKASCNSVNHIADAAAVDGYDQPTLKICERPALAGELPDNGGGEQHEHHHKQPLGTLECREGGAFI